MMSKSWYPVIDRKKCIGCMRCLKVCKKNNLKTEFLRSRPKVVSPEACDEGCDNCGRLCPAEAITYPGN